LQTSDGVRFPRPEVVMREAGDVKTDARREVRAE
jgi:hypothetical protein